MSNDLLEIIYEQHIETMFDAPSLMNDKDAKAIKANLQIIRSTEQTFVIVIALHKDMNKNDLQKVPCAWGTPLGGYVYDNVNHCYYVKCVAFQSLGYVPLACCLRAKDSYFWKSP